MQAHTRSEEQKHREHFFLHQSVSQLLSTQSLPHSLRKTPRGVGPPIQETLKLYLKSCSSLSANPFRMTFLANHRHSPPVTRHCSFPSSSYELPDLKSGLPHRTLRRILLARANQPAHPATAFSSGRQPSPGLGAPAPVVGRRWLSMARGFCRMA